MARKVHAIAAFARFEPRLRQWVPKAQLSVMREGARGEERAYFDGVAAQIIDTVTNMPKTYEQDGKGDDAVVYLHYFHGSMDWWITEKDAEEDQLQAFGLADLGYGGELGYICIPELLHGAELDLHWTPKTLREIKEQMPTGA
jgi:hypothetical protein